MVEQASDENLPRRFFKYRSMADDRAREWLRQTIVENKFYWASPSEFNDPFDCSPTYAAPDRADVDKLVRKILDRFEPGLNRRDRRVREKELKVNARSGVDEHLKKNMPGIINETAIYSLATNEDIILMWSHYACSHEGVCLGFSARVLMDHFKFIFPVRYSEARPVIKVGRDEPREIAEKLILIKASFWNYENEWRAIDYRGRPGVRTFPPDALVSVTLGARISEANAALVRQWVQQRQKPIEIYRATADPEMFRLVVEEVPHS